MGKARWCGVAGIVSVLVMASGLAASPGMAGASTSPTAKWFHRYGGHLRAVNDDVVLLDKDAQAQNPRFVQDCRALTSDSSEMVNLGPIPNKAFNRTMLTAMTLLSKGSMECQASAAGSTDASANDGAVDLRNGIFKLEKLDRELAKKGLLITKVKAEHVVIPSSSPTTTTTAPGNHVGATLSTSTIAIQLQQVIDPASADDSYITPDTGDRFVGVKVQISNPGTANIEDDANNDFTVIGSNGQIYSPDFDTLAGCTNFNDGDYGLTPGASVVGCVTFQVPTGVNITQVDFVGSDSRAQWQVP